MRNAILIGILVFTCGAQALEKDIETDILVSRITGLLKAEKHAEALPLFEKLEGMDAKMPESFDYYYIETLDKAGKAAKAVERSEAYLKKYGKKGKYYGQVIEIVGRRSADVERKPVAEATRPPVSARPAPALGAMRPGKVFKDCADCPEMVVLPTGIAMGRTEVTQGQWISLMGDNPSSFKTCGDDCPVDNVSWNDAQDYLKRLSAKTGKSYRLPNEAEWEAACLAGERTEYCGGNDLDAVGWYNRSSDGQKHPVAQKRANAWGLYDMTGSVWEWQDDCRKGDCSRRVLRGGSWNNGSINVRVSSRDEAGDGDRNSYVGFRLARTLP